MGQQSSILVSALSGSLEPAREAGMEPRPLGGRQALVGDVAGQRVLDRELALADDGRPRSVTDEVALLEQAKVRLEALEELVDGAGPERASDHGGRLQRRLLGRLQEIDAGRQNRTHRVRHVELAGELVRGPAAVLTFEHAPVDQSANELFDEERIALRPLDDDLADRGGQLRRNELVEHASGVRRGERLEPERLAVAIAAAPGGRVANQLGPRRTQQEQRTADVLQSRLEKVEERLLAPVQVLHQHDCGLIGHELLEKVDPRVA
jgi:hypothetical protein